MTSSIYNLEYFGGMDAEHKYNPCLELKQKSLECQLAHPQQRELCSALMRDYLGCRKRWVSGWACGWWWWGLW